MFHDFSVGHLFGKSSISQFEAWSHCCPALVDGWTASKPWSLLGRFLCRWAWVQLQSMQSFGKILKCGQSDHDVSIGLLNGVRSFLQDLVRPNMNEAMKTGLSIEFDIGVDLRCRAKQSWQRRRSSRCPVEIHDHPRPSCAPLCSGRSVCSLPSDNWVGRERLQIGFGAAAGALQGRHKVYLKKNLERFLTFGASENTRKAKAIVWALSRQLSAGDGTINLCPTQFMCKGELWVPAWCYDSEPFVAKNDDDSPL